MNSVSSSTLRMFLDHTYKHLRYGTCDCTTYHSNDILPFYRYDVANKMKLAHNLENPILISAFLFCLNSYMIKHRKFVNLFIIYTKTILKVSMYQLS